MCVAIVFVLGNNQPSNTVAFSNVPKTKYESVTTDLGAIAIDGIVDNVVVEKPKISSKQKVASEKQTETQQPAAEPYPQVTAAFDRFYSRLSDTSQLKVLYENQAARYAAIQCAGYFEDYPTALANDSTIFRIFRIGKCYSEATKAFQSSQPQQPDDPVGTVEPTS